MALLKHEWEFKKRLEQREIAPTTESWKKLQDKLDHEDNENRRFRKSYIWMGVAASVIAGILVFSFFFKNEVAQNPIVVDSPVIQEEPEPSGSDVFVVSEEKTKVEQTAEEEKKERIAEPLLKHFQPEQQVVVKAEEIEPAPIASDELFLKKAISEEVIANTTKGEENGVTDAEVDALLQDALMKLELEENSKTATLTARDLLWETEIEMEHSLSEKVLELLKEGYTKTKTAVVDGDF